MSESPPTTGARNGGRVDQIQDRIGEVRKRLSALNDTMSTTSGYPTPQDGAGGGGASERGGLGDMYGDNTGSGGSYPHHHHHHHQHSAAPPPPPPQRGGGDMQFHHQQPHSGYTPTDMHYVAAQEGAQGGPIATSAAYVKAQKALQSAQDAMATPASSPSLYGNTMRGNQPSSHTQGSMAFEAPYSRAELSHTVPGAAGNGTAGTPTFEEMQSMLRSKLTATQYATPNSSGPLGMGAEGVLLSGVHDNMGGPPMPRLNNNNQQPQLPPQLQPIQDQQMMPFVGAYHQQPGEAQELGAAGGGGGGAPLQTGHYYGQQQPQQQQPQHQSQVAQGQPHQAFSSAIEQSSKQRHPSRPTPEDQVGGGGDREQQEQHQHQPQQQSSSAARSPPRGLRSPPRRKEALRQGVATPKRTTTTTTLPRAPKPTPTGKNNRSTPVKSASTTTTTTTGPRGAGSSSLINGLVSGFSQIPAAAAATSPIRATQEGETQSVMLSGAEVFAILRLRGVMSSTPGVNTGEHQLPTTPLHQMYLSENEVEQLHHLRETLKKESRLHLRGTSAGASRVNASATRATSPSASKTTTKTDPGRWK